MKRAIICSFVGPACILTKQKSYSECKMLLNRLNSVEENTSSVSFIFKRNFLAWRLALRSVIILWKFKYYSLFCILICTLIVRRCYGYELSTRIFVLCEAIANTCRHAWHETLTAGRHQYWDSHLYCDSYIPSHVFLFPSHLFPIQIVSYPLLRFPEGAIDELLPNAVACIIFSLISSRPRQRKIEYALSCISIFCWFYVYTSRQLSCVHLKNEAFITIPGKRQKDDRYPLRYIFLSWHATPVTISLTMK